MPKLKLLQTELECAKIVAHNNELDHTRLHRRMSDLEEQRTALNMDIFGVAERLQHVMYKQQVMHQKIRQLTRQIKELEDVPC